MDPIINFNIEGLANEAAPDNNSSALQTAPDYPASLGDPELEFDPFKGFDQSAAAAALTVPETYVRKGPVVSYDAVNKYKGTSAYSPYMSPAADSEAIAASNWSMWDAIGTGLSGLTDNAINAGKEYAYGWVRAGRALVNFDSDYLKPSEFETQVIGAQQKLVGMDNPIYFDPGTRDDIFTRGFAAEFLQNTGFTFGTLGGFLTETALFGGAGKLFTKLPSLFKAGAAAKSLRMSEAGLNATSKLTQSQLLDDQIKNLYGSGIFTGKTVFDNALNVASKLPIVGAVADAGKTIRAARSLGAVEGAGTIALTGTELAKIGAGGLKRAFSEWNFAASEAAIEAGGAYGEVYDSLYDEYVRKNNGKLPEGEELQRIRELALDASSAGYNTNFAVLAIMNKIQFGNLFRNFGTDSKFLSLLRNDADRVIAVNGIDQGGKALTKLLPKGYWGALGHKSEIVNTFGKSTFYRELGRDLIRGVGRIEITEGLQENIQEGTNEFLKKYYGDLYDDNVANFGASFREAFDSQMTKRGFKTFLQGALTGFMIRPVTGAAQAARNAYLEKKAAQANPEHVNALQSTLNRLNLAMADPEKVLKENHRIVKEQVMLNDGMTKGAAIGDKYAYLNNKDSAIIRLALDAKRTGTFDAFKTMLTNYGQSLDNQEFKEATGIDLEAEGISSAAEYTDTLVSKLDKYSNVYDKYNKMFGDFISLEGIIQDDYSKQRFKFAQSAIQDAIHTAAFNEAKADVSLERAADIAQSVANIRGIGQSAAANFNTVTDHGMASQQIRIINNEIKTLKESGPLDPEAKRLIASKEKERDLLEQWNNTAYSEEVIATEEGEISKYVPLNQRGMTEAKRKELAKTLADYYNVKNQQSGSAPPIINTDVENVLNSINDYQKLSRDTKDYLDAVNLLSDPKNLVRAAQAYEDARVAAFARQTHDTFITLAEESGIFADYIKANPQEMENLLKIARTPFGSYDNVAAVMKSVININNLVEQDEQKAAAAQAAPPTPAISLAAAVNIGAMSEQDAAEFITTHYDYIENEDDDLLGIKRFYIDENGNEVITHNIDAAAIEAQYPGLSLDEIAEKDGLIRQFVRSFEQELYYLQNPGTARTDQQPAERQENITEQAKKLFNLVGQKVLYMGKPGTLKEDGKNYFIEYEDGDTTVLGPIAKDTVSRFRWRKLRNKFEYKLEEINPDPMLSTDSYPYLHILPDNMTEEERRLTGESLDAIAMRVEDKRINVQYKKDESGEVIDIGGNPYTVLRDASDKIISMTYEFEAGKIVFTSEEAEREPDGLASKYIAIANMAYVHNAELDDAQLDTGIQKAKEAAGSQERVIATTRERSIKLRQTRQMVEQTEGAIELIDRIMQSVPDELMDAFDSVMSMNTSKLQEIPRESKLKLLDWAQGAVKKLNNLDKNNPDVISYITLLNDLIIGPMAKKDGRRSTEKQPKKATSKESKTPVAPAPVAPASGEPSAPSNYKREQGTIAKAAAHVDRNYDKKDRELAVKIEDLLPNQQNLFNQMEIEDASNVSKFNKKSYRSGISKKTDVPEDPYNNPPLTCE